MSSLQIKKLTDATQQLNTPKTFHHNKNGEIKITKHDALIVVDMQNDFLPKRTEEWILFENGDKIEVEYENGSLAVPHGDETISGIVDLIDKFNNNGCKIALTRDYQPEDHCSYIPQGGPFPVHCVYNEKGAHLSDTICEKLKECDENAKIFFKGYNKDIDSFGGMQYLEGKQFHRVSSRNNALYDQLDKTGGVSWKSFAAWKQCRFDARTCPTPDQLNEAVDKLVEGTENSDVKPLEDWLHEHNIQRIFCVGLTLEYCVLDTTINGADHGFESYHVVNCTRALPSFDAEDSELPKECVLKMSQAKFVESSSLDFGSGKGSGCLPCVSGDCC